MSAFLLQCSGGEHKPVQETPPPTSGQEPASPQQQSPTQGDGPPAFTGPTFEDVKPIFESKCQACHMRGSGLPVWTNYVDAFSKSGRIHERTVIKKDMPPTGAPQLTAEEISLIDEWIEHGSLESAPTITQSGDGPQNQGDDSASINGDGASILSAPSPVEPPMELEGTKVYCRTTDRHPIGNVSKNRYFSAVLGEDLLSSRVYSTAVRLDLFGRIQTVEDIGFLKSIDRSTMELCHTAVLDYYRCQISKKIVRIDVGEISVSCAYPNNTTELNIRIWDGRGIVECRGPDVSFTTEYRNCRITE